MRNISTPVVHKLGSGGLFQGFVGLVHPILIIHDVTLCLASLALIKYIVIYICCEFEEKTLDASMNAIMELVGFSTSRKAKNHYSTLTDANY